VQSKLCISANAKINLDLQVLAKLGSGYHLLRSIVYPIGLADELAFSQSQSPGVQLEVTFEETLKSHLMATSWGRAEIENFKTKQNLIFKAAELVLSRATSKLSAGVKISLLKKTPLGAGLGGGSADAAAAIKGVNQFYELGLCFEELLSIGAEIGSDVSALLFNTPVFMFSKGERCLPIENFSKSLLGKCLENVCLVIIKPLQNVPTKDAYLGLGHDVCDNPDKFLNPWQDTSARQRLALFGLEFDLSRAEPQLVANGKLGANDSGHIVEETLKVLQNDFEQSVYQTFFEVGLARDILNQAGAIKTLLSGSGSSVIGFFNKSDSDKEKLRQNLEVSLPKDWFLFLN
jgi:4-diphosphocytidyl-2-C-methyl-D-erythritol kinase